MRQYHVYKKLFSLILFVCASGLIAAVPISHAQNARDLQNKIEAKNNEIAKLEAEIKQFQNQLNDLGQQKSSLNVSLKELDISRKKLVADIAVTQNKIDKTNFKIEGLSSQIHTKQESIDTDIEAIMLGIRKTNEFEEETVLETLLSENDFSLLWNEIDTMATIREKIRDSIKELKQIKGELEDTRQETLDAKEELEELRSELADQKKIVEQNTAEKNKLLSQTKNNEANFQKLLSETQTKKLAFEKEVSDYESQLQYILDPSKLPRAGVLSWPLETAFITQVFGKTEAGKRLYANGTHNGVDFRAAVGTPILAMADGVIAGTGDTDKQCYRVSFGRFVLIKYDNGLASTYGHLSLIKVEAGQRVKRGQIVGYSGNTGYSTAPHLHVSVYAKDAVDISSVPSKVCVGRMLTMPISPINAYLDPLYYMPPTVPSMFK